MSRTKNSKGFRFSLNLRTKRNGTNSRTQLLLKIKHKMECLHKNSAYKIIHNLKMQNFKRRAKNKVRKWGRGVKGESKLKINSGGETKKASQILGQK